MTLAALLREQGRVARLTDEEWDVVIRQARRAGLLARLALLARRQEFYAGLAERPRRHLEAAALLSAKHRRDVLYELDRIYEVLGSLLGTIVLLKGAAYLAAGLPAAEGRIFSDIDILVPADKIAAVESLLQLAGWRAGDVDPYDDRYYRRWMHQIPPLTHAGRHSTIDVHHSIVPPTARVGVATAADLLTRSRALPGRPGWAVLAPEDMVLHSATHLFNEGEFGNGLRDLSDLDLLLRDFGVDNGFWRMLTARAVELGLTRPLFYGLRHAARVFATPVPADMAAASRAFGPMPPVVATMDAILTRALKPHHKTCRDVLTGPALFALYVRAHYLRMPLHLLLPHLVRKSLRRTGHA